MKSRTDTIYLFTFLLWMKLYVVQRFHFDFPIFDWIDELVMLVGTLSSAIVLSMCTLLIARKRTDVGFFIMSVIGSVLALANVIYFRFFHDFITVPVLLQSSNVSTLEHSLLHLLQFPGDLLIVADTALIGFYILLKKSNIHIRNIPRISAAFFSILVLCITLSWTAAYSSSTEEQMSRTADRMDVVKHAGIINYQLYDMVAFIRANTKKWFAEQADYHVISEELEELLEPHASNARLEGIAKNKNVIFISLESLQSFALEKSIASREVTPFLNRLINESFYFSNLYDQTAQGKTSDAEFIVETSLYPLPSGSVFYTHANNTFHTLTDSLKENGYTTAVFHANDASFWNREVMYETIGYDHFFDVTHYEVNEENIIGWGLNDLDFFEQSIPLLKQLPTPFAGKFITLTNHHPFEIDHYEQWKARIDTENETIRQYFATVHYMDRALEYFFRRLKEEGLYENTIFVLYGDHYGLSPNYYDDLIEVLNLEANPITYMELGRVPLIIHIPGEKGYRDHRVAGQVDIRPTVLHLLGINEPENQIGFGHELTSFNRPSFAVLRDGSFITERIVYYNSSCYSKMSGEIVESADCEEKAMIASEHLTLSDDIIYGDLLRFSDEDE